MPQEQPDVVVKDLMYACQKVGVADWNAVHATDWVVVGGKQQFSTWMDALMVSWSITSWLVVSNVFKYVE